jgi:hypothetical protein
MDLGGKMTRTEAMKLTPDQKKQRRKLLRNKDRAKYREANKDKTKAYREANKDKTKAYQEVNKEKIAKQRKEYREANKDKAKEYYQTPKAKKVNRIAAWKLYGLQEKPENIERIHDLWLNQEYCNACDIKLTRDGKKSTQACMDHDHDTNRFRHIICRGCNIKDTWKKHFC